MDDEGIRFNTLNQHPLSQAARCNLSVICVSWRSGAVACLLFLNDSPKCGEAEHRAEADRSRSAQDSSSIAVALIAWPEEQINKATR
jgi:hypothetical protein